MQYLLARGKYSEHVFLFPLETEWCSGKYLVLEKTSPLLKI